MAYNSYKCVIAGCRNEYYPGSGISFFRFTILCVTVWCICVECQPTGCTDDAHCEAGYFCEASFCRECLRCKTFLREDPLVHTLCVQSVTQCGNCLDGLITDRSGDPSSSCVAPSAESGVPLYVWVCIGIAVPLVPVAALIIFTYATSKLTLFKISGFTSTHTFQGGGVGGPAREPQGSAPPMPPPPYNTHFDDTPLYVQEEASPLVKLSAGDGAGGREAREVERGVGARVFNNPAYVRTAPIPHSPSPTLEETVIAEPALHDENTMESVWTPVAAPEQTANNVRPIALERGEGENAIATVGEAGVVPGGGEGVSAVAGVGVGVGAGGARRRSHGDTGPPAKQLCLTQGESSRSGSGAREDAPAGPSVMLNFNLNVNANAVQQLNNVTLFE